VRIRYLFSSTVGLELVKKEIIFCEIDESHSVSCRAHVVLVPAKVQITIICKISMFVDKDFKTKTGSRSLAR
jgi:hypothetical protein